MNDRQQNLRREIPIPYWRSLVENNFVWKELKTSRIFEDIQFGEDRIEQMYQEHRLKVIQANWKFILLALKALFMAIAICLQLQGGYVSVFERIVPIALVVILFGLKYFIYKNNPFARHGAVFIILLLGLVLTNINLEFTQFR